MNRKRNHVKSHLNHFQYDKSERVGSRKSKQKLGKHLNEDCESFPFNLHKRTKEENFVPDNDSSKGHASNLRKRVDPETAKYFLEITNLFESNGVDIDVRPTVCDNALEETRGKEIELATDMIISRTLQCLLEGCNLEQLCSFLRGCAKGFSCMAVDKFGSHVAETALKSLAMRLQDDQSYLLVEEALHNICQVVSTDAVNIMRSPYGSHVLRSLLCLCKGVPLDSLEGYHVTKPSTILTERFCCVPVQSRGNDLQNSQKNFPDTFNFLVQEIMRHAKVDISSLRVEKNSSFVLQSLLKLSLGNDQVLVHAILILLGCHEGCFIDNMFTDVTKQKLKEEFLVLIEDTAASHLLEVIVEVAPNDLYNELLDVIFKGPLWEISTHHFGNFVMQALISSARTREHVNLIWEGLGPYLCQLLEAGKPGVVASILATCQRLQTNVDEVYQALSVAASPESESPSCIITHLLHLDSYFRNKTNWKWPLGEKMNVLGCLMLQNIFKSSNSIARPYFSSIICMETDHVLEMAKDVGGSRVLEAFLCSDSLAKHKLEIITKLQGHFGELSMSSCGSFTVEKCFISSNVPMKEIIAKEVQEFQTELSKTRHGPHLLKKLDIEGFCRNPEQWKSRHKSKAAAYRDYLATFGGKDQAAAAPDAPDSSKKLPEKKRKRQEKANASIETMPSSTFVGSNKSRLISSNTHDDKRPSSSGSNPVKFLSGKCFIRNNMKAKSGTKNHTKNPPNSDLVDLADLAGKSKLSQGDVQKLFDPITAGDKKQHPTPFLRKKKK